MQALIKHQRGKGHVGLAEVAPPEPGLGQVSIAVQAAGICGTDIHILHDTFPYSPPVILGHEFSGEIVSLGAGVEDIAVGDRVMAETTAALCGECRFCKTGQTNLCAKRKVYGVHVDGGFAQFVVVRKEAIHRLPPNVDYTAGAMTEPLAVCVHALMERVEVQPGELVLILGPGPIGLLAAVVAKVLSARVVVAGTDKDLYRLRIATELGVDRTVNVDHEDLAEVSADLSGDKAGADITVEASGNARAVASAYQCTRKGGTVVQLGLFEGPITVDYSQVAFREFRVIGSFAHRWSSFEAALDLMGRKVMDIQPLVSAVLPLQQWEEAFQNAENSKGVKFLLAP